jgi:nucleotide-binding universal stress UspA family protein
MGSVSLPFPEGAPHHEEGSPVRILFRPETVSVQTQGVPPDKDLKLLVQGQVTERIFAGSQQRLRIAVESLQGIRPVMPMPVYGRRLTQIEAIQPNLPGGEQLSPGQMVRIGLKAYHILEPTGLKILIYPGPSRETDEALDFGCRFAEAARGPTTILTVVEQNTSLDEAHSLNATIKPKHFLHLSNLSTKIRQGDIGAEVISEAQEGHYEVVVISRQAKAPNLSGPDFGSIAQQVLIDAALPVLLVGTSRQKIERILICTAAGEPGKVDVLFGARVARQVGAHATILHVLRPRPTQSEVRRVERHLRQAQSSLEAVGVASECRLKENVPVVDGIIQEAEEGNYDLIVIGAPMQPLAHQYRWIDTASKIIEGTDRPILVVPMVS